MYNKFPAEDELTGKELKYINCFNFYVFEKLDFNEKHQFLIKNKILIKGEKIKNYFQCVYDRVIIENKVKEFKFDTSVGYNGYNYSINQEIIDEYYEYLFTRIENENIYVDWVFHINHIENKIKLLFDKKLIEEILTENYNKQALIFSSYRLDFDYLNKPIEEYNNWKDYVTDCFEDDLYIYLSGTPFDNREPSITLDWCEIKESREIMFYCKSELDKLKNDKTTKQENQHLYKTSNYPLVFVNLDKEIFFKNYLKIYDAIDEKEKPIKGTFQPYCDAFFRACKELEDDSRIKTPKVIQRGRNKTKFIAMINKEYNQTISKLSSGLNYTNVAVEFIFNSLGNKKE